MANQSWTLTVSYVNGVATITDANGGTGDETIFQGESETITFQPGNGVRAVTVLTVTRPSPLPSGVSVTQTTSGNSCVVTDSDSLADTALEVDVVYCINFTDSNGVARTTDPKLINMPTIRSPQNAMLARTARSQPAAAKGKPAARNQPAAVVRPAARPAPKSKPSMKPQAKPAARPALGRSRQGR